MVASAEHPNHIVTVIQKGYLLRDRLLRPAMVLGCKALKSRKYLKSAGRPILTYRGGPPQILTSRTGTWQDYRHRPRYHELLRGGRMEGDKVRSSRTARATAPRRPSSRLATTTRWWSASRPSARRSPIRPTRSTPSRLIGRKFSEDVGAATSSSCRTKSQAKNGDAWVEAHGKQMAAEISRVR